MQEKCLRLAVGLNICLLENLTYLKISIPQALCILIEIINREMFEPCIGIRKGFPVRMYDPRNLSLTANSLIPQSSDVRVV